MKRDLYTDRSTGKRVTLEQDNHGNTILHQEQSFDHVLRSNKEASRDYQKGSMIGNTQRHMQHIAEIPIVVYNHLIETLGPPHQNQKAWKAWLNDNQNRDFRTGGGQI